MKDLWIKRDEVQYYDTACVFNMCEYAYTMPYRKTYCMGLGIIEKITIPIPVHWNTDTSKVLLELQRLVDWQN